MHESPSLDVTALSGSFGLVALDAISVPLMIQDADGRVQYVNQALRHLLSSGDANESSWDLCTDQHAAVLQQLCQKALADFGTVFSDEISCTTPTSAFDRVLSVRSFAIDGNDANSRLVVLSFVDVSSNRLLHRMLRLEREIQGLLLDELPLADVLTALARGYEALFPQLLCSVLLLDAAARTLHTIAAPSLPATYCAAIDGTPIGDRAGSCGTAAHTRESVFVDDIASDARWEDFKDLAIAHGLRACWSVPILSANRTVLGTFAVYHTQVQKPSDDEVTAISAGAKLACLAIETSHRKRRLEQQRETLRDALSYQAAILENMSDGVITIDDHGRIKSYNQAAQDIFQWSSAEAVGRNVSMLMPSPHREQHDRYIDDYRQTGVARVVGFARDVDGQRRDGSVFPISLSVSEVRSGGKVSFVGIVRDITQRKANEEEIRRLAYYDPLTELPNRRLLFDRLKQAKLTSARTGQHGALLFLDLDHFKELNDSLGHTYGDELLRNVATRLLDAVREGDSVARLGGDEYVVLIEALHTDMAEAALQAEGVAKKVMHALVQPYKLFGHDYQCTPSIGIALFLESHESQDDIIKKADAAMYQAKAAGRNAIRFFDEAMQQALAHRAQLDRELRRAVANGEFILHFQRQVGRDQQTLGAEALIRWQHPQRGLIGPGAFIELAEETGQIILIGTWVIREACRVLKTWELDATRREWTLAVNVSALQFAQSDFVEVVAHALTDFDFRPEKLKLELTESMVVGDIDGVIARMQAIRDLGVAFSLDDFGTGYSSLSHLKRLPLHQLKIDQSFVRDLSTDQNAQAIARAIIGMAISLGLYVIAEGVESSEQFAFLSSLGCHAFQGYLLGRPVPEDAL